LGVDPCSEADRNVQRSVKPELQGCIKLVNHNVAADVSRLKLSNFVQLFACAAENYDPAHAGCCEKRRA
jgi:hypothetical protein